MQGRLHSVSDFLKRASKEGTLHIQTPSSHVHVLCDLELAPHLWASISLHEKQAPTP